jgi:putative aldouronate transport system permease protein
MFLPGALGRPGQKTISQKGLERMAASPDGRKNRSFKGYLANTGRLIVKHKEKYVLILPGMVWYVIFAYIPIFGLTLAFKQYVAKLGLFASPWIGLENYSNVFADPAFLQSMFTTLKINAGRLLFVFPFPILFALMINEIRLGRSKKVLQSVYTFPHFLSWVIVASIMISVLGQRGLVNSFLGAVLGMKPISFLGTPSYFLPVVYVTDIWKSAGWSAIIYMAAISGIDTERYEAAEMDGASRLQRMWYITLPGIKPTIFVLFILAVGYLMSGGFDQIFNLSNPATMKVAETLDMYIYRITFRGSVDFSFSAAVALIRSVVNLLLLFAADRFMKRTGGAGLLA